MRTYVVLGMADERVAEAVRRSLEGHYGDSVTVETDVQSGTVRVDRAADPQVVSLLVDSAGCGVVTVGD